MNVKIYYIDQKSSLWGSIKNIFFLKYDIFGCDREPKNNEV